MPEQKIAVNSKHRVKVISSSDPVEFEEETNKFLDTISDERLLVSLTFLAAGSMLNNVIYYRELSPMTREDYVRRMAIQKKFSEGFIPNNLMPNGEDISKL
jgi:hypothetical protein